MRQPVSIIQAILRHKPPNTTALYLKSLVLEEMRGALDSMADRFRTVSLSQEQNKAKVVFFPAKQQKSKAEEGIAISRPQVKLRRKQA